jgi:hypothetical protein
MTFNKRLIAAITFAVLASSANAAPETFTIERDSDDGGFSNPFGLKDLSGFGSFGFSKSLVAAVNLSSTSMQVVPDAALQTSTSTNPVGQVKYVSVGVALPLTSLSFSAEGSSLIMRELETDGGLLLTTTKNSATHGAGSLSISDLKVDLTTKTIYADIVGANGVGTLNDHALWQYTAISGPTTVEMDPWGPPGRRLPPNMTLSGLFLVSAADVDNIFVKALNLNNTGRSPRAARWVCSVVPVWARP